MTFKNGLKSLFLRAVYGFYGFLKLNRVAAGVIRRLKHWELDGDLPHGYHKRKRWFFPQLCRKFLFWGKALGPELQHTYRISHKNHIHRNHQPPENKNRILNILIGSLDLKVGGKFFCLRFFIFSDTWPCVKLVFKNRNSREAVISWIWDSFKIRYCDTKRFVVIRTQMD